MIQAGLTPTQTQVGHNQQAIAANQEATAANKQQIDANEQAVDNRFKDLTDYDVKKEAVVKFDVGKSELSQADKDKLSELASSTKNLQGYLIEVKGYADSSGNAAFNQTLSRDRAENVIEYLMQDASVSPRHIVAPGAMGVSDPAASNETAEGRSENRRVEVKVLLNKGLQPSSMAAPQ
jgi:outer membrane protein OmpA-like peptidoglycan-associated protein